MQAALADSVRSAIENLAARMRRREGRNKSSMSFLARMALRADKLRRRIRLPRLGLGLHL